MKNLIFRGGGYEKSNVLPKNRGLGQFEILGTGLPKKGATVNTLKNLCNGSFKNTKNCGMLLPEGVKSVK